MNELVSVHNKIIRKSPTGDVGKWVIAFCDFMTDSQIPIMIPNKSLCVILEIAESGAALIEFEQNLGQNIQEWVLSEHFENLQLLSQASVQRELQHREKLVEDGEKLLRDLVSRAPAADKPASAKSEIILEKPEIIDTFAKTENVCRQYLQFLMISLFSAQEVELFKSNENENLADSADITKTGPYTQAGSLAIQTSWYKFNRHIDPKHDNGMWTELCKYLYREHSPWNALLNTMDNETHEMSVFVKNYAKYVLQLCNIDANTKLTYTYHPTEDTQSLKVRPHKHSITALKTWELTFQQSSNGSITISYKGHQVPCNTKMVET
jgi:hypothetical protein